MNHLESKHPEAVTLPADGEWREAAVWLLDDLPFTDNLDDVVRDHDATGEWCAVAVADRVDVLVRLENGQVFGFKFRTVYPDPLPRFELVTDGTAS